MRHNISATIQYICRLKHTLVFCALLLLMGCGGDDTPGTVCGAGTSLQNTECTPSAEACGTGTMIDSTGQCVPSQALPMCADGEQYDTTQQICVPASMVSCGEGTLEEEGVCVPDVAPTTCATDEYIDDQGTCAKLADLCGTGTSFDEAQGVCVRGTVLEGPCSQAEPVELPDPIDQDLILEEGGCYKVTTMIDFEDNARLTVKPGVEIVFDDGKVGFQVDAGFLSVEGTADSPVLMRPLVPQNRWQGISFLANPTEPGANSLEHVVIRRAGGRDWGTKDASAVSIAGPAELSFDHVTIEDSGGWGIKLLDIDADVSITNSTFTDNASGAAKVLANLAGAFDNSNTFTTDAEPRQWIRIEGGDVTDDQTWADQAPLLIAAELEVVDNVTLTIEPTATLTFTQNTGIHINGGALVVEASLEGGTVFEGKSSDKGFWQGLLFSNRDRLGPASKLEGVVIRDAGGNEWGATTGSAAVIVGDDTVDLEITASFFRNNEDWAILADNAEGAELTIKTVLFAQDNEAGASMSPSLAGSFDPLFPSSFEDGQHVVLRNGPINSEQTWLKETPYLLYGPAVEVNAPLTIEAGSTVRARRTNAGLRVVTGGQLLARGTMAEPIIFRGEQDNALPGDWRGLSFNDSTGNVLRHVEIAHTGSQQWGSVTEPASLHFGDGGVELEVGDLLLRDGAGFGIRVDGNASPTLTGDCASVTFGFMPELSIRGNNNPSFSDICTSTP